MTKDESVRLAYDMLKIKARERSFKRWRILGVLALVMIAYSFFSPSSSSKQASVKDHIAVVRIDGDIGTYSEFWTDLERINNHTKAILFLIDSPGGSVVDSERLYNLIKHCQEVRPTALLVESSAASGSYMAALGANKIYAHNGSVIGSIGVISRHYVMEGVLESLGIKKEEYKTGRFKGFPNSLELMPDEVRLSHKKMIDDIFNWFKELVKTRRSLSDTSAIEEAQVYSAHDALKLGLIDGISTYDEQIGILREAVGDLPVRDLSVDETDVFGLSKLFKATHIKSMIGKVRGETSGGLFAYIN